MKLYEKKKKHFNIGTLGHVDHGKTTLTAALTKTLGYDGLAKFLDYNQIDSTKEEKERGITIVAAHVEYESYSRHFSHIDCPGHLNYIKNMITGATQMDGAILVVSLSDGPQEQTREHVILAKRVGIENLIVFVNKADEYEDLELFEVVKMEIEDLLEQHGYDLRSTPIIRGSALEILETFHSEWYVWYNKYEFKYIDWPDYRSALYELIRNMNKLPMPPRETKLPFLLPIKEVFSIPGRGTVVTGNIEQGTININDDVEISGIKEKSIQTKVIGLEVFHRSLEQASAGDNVGILVRGVKRDEIVRGQVLSSLGSVKVYKLFTAQIYFLLSDEGGRTKPIAKGYKPHFFIRTADISGVFLEIGENNVAFPGDTVECKILLDFNLVLTLNHRFTIREGNKTIGCGIIIDLIE